MPRREADRSPAHKRPHVSISRDVPWGRLRRFCFGQVLKLAGGADSGLEGGLRGCVGYQEERGEIREAERVVPLIFIYASYTKN
jgi:hypothetical protein